MFSIRTYVIVGIVFLLFLSLIFSGFFLLRRFLARSTPTPRPEITVTIPEGFTLADIEERLVEAGLPSAENLSGFKIGEWEKSRNPGGYEFLEDAPDGATLEGFLFPDTYRFFADSPATSVAARFLDNFDKKLVPEWRTELKKQNKKIYDAVIMASMVEKEVHSDEDRALVSGILWKRLESGMGLQVDATICYVKSVNRKAGYSGGQNEQKCLPITAEDKKINSLYNTYRYKGLPFGPIANPGEPAIKAAIYPQSSEYFYYLSAPDGTTKFSKTLEEHIQAKYKFLR